VVTRDNPNLAMLQFAADRLKPLLNDIALIGGCATGLLITDRAAAPARSTGDVDIIVAVSNYTKFTELEQCLRSLGFREYPEENVICRWRADDLIVDVIPTDTKILGFGNRWYEAALNNSQPIDIGSATVRVVTAPYFIATKLEAFRGRGNGDYLASRDIEDIISVIDGRPELIEEILVADPDLSAYLLKEFTSLLTDAEFLDAIPGHLMPDDASQDRRELVLDRIRSFVTS
jgi:predicted nucleotidyltransferase